MHLRSTFPSRLAMLMTAEESRKGQQQKKAPIHTFISMKLIICCLIAPRALGHYHVSWEKRGLHINLLNQPPPKQVSLSAVERLNAEKRHLGRSLWEPHTMMPFALLGENTAPESKHSVCGNQLPHPEHFAFLSSKPSALTKQ